MAGSEAGASTRKLDSPSWPCEKETRSGALLGSQSAPARHRPCEDLVAPAAQPLTHTSSESVLGVGLDYQVEIAKH